MTQTSLDNDKPLDPTLERVQRRLRRLMLIAGLTLGVGIFAVFGAILYRIMTLDATPAGNRAPFAVTLTPDALGLPADATLASTAVNGGRLALTYAHGGGHTVVFVDPASGAVVGRVTLPAR
jgi:hypothetical protein